MKLEWDEAKRQRTLQERGLDFADVARVDWDEALTLPDTRREYSEVRFITFTPLDGRLCVIGWCYRDDKVRIFSLRKANKREIRKYGQS